MPPKCKLHKSTGKVKSFPQRATEQLPAAVPSTSTSQNDMENSEVAQQFEVELCWCIQQLQTALKSGKLAERQIQDHKKALNVLMSNSTHIIKKRQVMRLSFGDYRAKMAAEDKKINPANKQIKVNPMPPSKKSVFIKKASTVQSNGNTLADSIINVKLESGEEEKRDDGKSISEEQTHEIFKFTHTNNSFKFNFNNNSQ